MAITNQSTLTSKYVLPDETEQEITTESNVSSTENMTESLVKEKSYDAEYVMVGGELTQTLVLTNNSEYDIISLTITDVLSEGVTFKAGSVEIDGVAYEDYDPTVGFELDSGISAGDSVTITFVVVADEEAEVSEFTDTTTLTYSVNEVELTEELEAVTVEIVSNKITIAKTSSVSAVVSGQTMTYQNEITNEGTLTNSDLFFTDPIPEGTTFVEGSVKIDGVEQPDYDPATGFLLDDLAAGATVTVTFDVTID